ncbi:MAG: oligosaccharide flippase family protein [bacterium]
MTGKVANIAKNTSYFTLALIIQKIISFSYFTIYARELGPEDLGKFYFAISFVSIFSIFVDLGLANVLTREVAKTKDRAAKLLNNALALKIPLAIFSWLAVIIIANVWGYSDIVRNLVYIASIVMVLDSFTTLFYASTRGFHNLKFESFAAVGYQLSVLIFSLIVLHYNWGMEWLMFALVIASTMNFIYSALVNIFKYKIRIWPQWDKQMIKTIIAITIPFGLYAIFQKVYTFTDTILLFKLVDDRAVGIYQIPFKIVMAFQFIPGAFVAALYPAMSKYWKENKEQLSITFERAMNYSIIVAMPIMVGIICLADELILIFKQGYAEAVLPLQIVMLSLFLMFLSYPIGSLLNACDRQKKNTINMAITALFSVTLNLILIPRLEVIGASITLTLSSLLLLFLGWRLVPQIINYRFWNIAKVFGKSLIASLFMGIFVYSFRTEFNLIISVIFGAVIYGVMLFLLGGFKKEDIISILQSFKRK